MRNLRKHLGTILVAFVAGAVGASMPAVAHGVQHALFAHNSAKVDGKSAVGSSATSAQREGKLVATNKVTGTLPNDIIEKAPDSELLGGQPPSDFALSAHSHDDRYYTQDQVDQEVNALKDDVWAYVTSSGGLHASSGNLTVTHPATGLYCVVVPKRSSHKAAQVTLTDPNGDKIVSQASGHGSACNPLSTATHDDIPVYIVTTADAAVDGNFAIFVPAA